MNNISMAIVMAYDYGTQKYSSWEGLKDCIYKNVGGDDGWFAVAGAYIAGRLQRIYGCKLVMNTAIENSYMDFRLVNKGHEVNLYFSCDLNTYIDAAILKGRGIDVVIKYFMLNTDGLLRQMKIEYLVGVAAYKAGRRTKEYMLLDQIIREILADLSRMSANRAARHAIQKRV